MVSMGGLMFDPWRRRKKNLLWLIPLGILVGAVTLPVLVFAMMIGTRLLSAVAGPVNIWNATRHAPQAANLAGSYQPSEKDSRRAGELRPGFSFRSSMKLAADHQAEVSELPGFNGFGESMGCTYNGRGEWRVLEAGGVMLNLDIKDSAPTPAGHLPSCGAASLGLELLGQSPPYRIWLYIGDPDEDTGVAYVRQSTKFSRK
jgi:hypothetical protein